MNCYYINMKDSYINIIFKAFNFAALRIYLLFFEGRCGIRMFREFQESLKIDRINRRLAK